MILIPPRAGFAMLCLAAITAPASAGGGFGVSSNGFSGCEPHCEATDAAIRHVSADPTDPTKFGAKISKLGVRPVVGDALDKAQKYVATQDFVQALVAAQTAQAAAATDYEKLKVDEVLIGIHLGMKDQTAAVAAAEAAADLSFIPANEKPDVYANAAILATGARHADKATKYAKAMQALNLTDDRSKRIIDRALALSGNPPADDVYKLPAR